MSVSFSSASVPLMGLHRMREDEVCWQEAAVGRAIHTLMVGA